MKDRSDDPSHHERTLLPWSYISLLREREEKEKETGVREKEKKGTDCHRMDKHGEREEQGGQEE